MVVDYGFDHEEMIDRNELRDLVPAVAPHCIGGMVVRDDGYANPYQTVQAFRRKAISLGVRIVENNPLVSLKKQSGL